MLWKLNEYNNINDHNTAETEAKNRRENNEEMKYDLGMDVQTRFETRNWINVSSNRI